MKPFSYGKIFAIGSGFFAISVVWMVYNTFMPLLLGEFIESKTLRGGIMGLDNLLAVLLIPIIGTWSDRVNGKLGQRLPFIVVGMPLAALLLAVLPLGSASLWVLLGIDILFLLAMTVYRAPVVSLMPDHTPPEKRSSANGVINLMGGVGSLIALFGLAKLYDTVGPGAPFWAAAVILLLSFAFLFFVIDRKPPYSSSVMDEADEAAARQSLGNGLKRLLRREHRSQLFILIAIFLYFIGYAGVEAQFSTYATESLGVTAGVAGTTLGFFSLSFVLFAVPAGLIGNKIGKGRTMGIGLLLMPTLFLFVPFFDNLWAVRILLLLGGFSWALINVQAYPLVAGFGGKTQIGFFTGLYYLFSMLSQIIAPALLGGMMDLFGNSTMFFGAAAAAYAAFFCLRIGMKGMQKDA